MSISARIIAGSIRLGGNPAARIINRASDAVGRVAKKMYPRYRVGSDREHAVELLASRGLILKWDPMNVQLVKTNDSHPYMGPLGGAIQTFLRPSPLPKGFKIRVHDRLNGSLIEGILAIEEEAFPKAIRFSRLHLEERASIPDYRVLSLEDPRGRMAGYVIGHHAYGYAEGTYYISSLALATDFRGHGLGKVLMERILQKARSCGYKMAVLNAISPDIDGRDMIKFYESLGFIEVYTIMGRKL